MCNVVRSCDNNVALLFEIRIRHTHYLKLLVGSEQYILDTKW